MSENILQNKNLYKYFADLAVASNYSLKIKKGSITEIIGPNSILPEKIKIK
jgi:branched-chain amino acid transport system ATP-binding protein